MPVAKVGPAASQWSPWWLPELLGQQIVLIGPWLFLASVPWVSRFAEPNDGSRAGDPSAWGGFSCSPGRKPILIFYAIVSLITEPEGNWPMAAYATVLPWPRGSGPMRWAQRVACRARGGCTPGPVKLRIRLWRIGISYAIIAAVFVHMMDRVGDVALALDSQAWFHDRYHRLLAAIRASPNRPFAIQRVGCARGRWRGMFPNCSRDCAMGHKREPFVEAQHYGRASQLAYYLRQGRPWTEVLCAM